MAKRKKHRAIVNAKSPAIIRGNFHIGTLVDVIIPVLNRFDLLKQCLDALPSAFGDIPYKVIIYDNASKKEDADAFYESLVGTRIIRNKQNVGFPKACNLAFVQGASPLIFFLNSDVILQPDCMKLMIKEMDDPKIGAVGMKLIFPEVTDLKQSETLRPGGKVQHVGLASNIHGDFIHIFIGWSPDHPKVNAVRNMYAITGAAMLTRRSLFQQAGKFYEGYGLGNFEDVDYCLTIRKMGYNIIVVPQAVGTHYTGATAEKHNLRYPYNENKMIFLQRWSKELDWSEGELW